jgi:hypothetical protein
MATKDTLRHLIDTLPDTALDEAECYLTALQTDDPVLRAALLAPYDDEPETEEERAAVDEALEDVREGRMVSMQEIEREFGA